MSCSFGESVRVTIFGQSHSLAVGVTLDGIPSGFRIDMERLRSFLCRRAPGKNELSTCRREEDEPEFLSGLCDGVTCGAPLTAVIYNRDVKPEDYAAFRDTPRPGHADYTAWAKYGTARDVSGGGQFSGRLTAPLCVAGGVCLQLLEQEKISINARIEEIAGTSGTGAMEESIRAAKKDGDSVGGVIACEIRGVPAGVGEPMFGGMENRISQAVFAVPAVKGIEFGAGFGAARLRGSDNNDAFAVENGRIVTKTNHCGGILGGITTGMPITFRVAIKPTPSISKVQKSVDLTTMREAELIVGGRHDPCIVPRAVPAVEAAAAIAVYDALITDRKYCKVK